MVSRSIISYANAPYYGRLVHLLSQIEEEFKVRTDHLLVIDLGLEESQRAALVKRFERVKVIPFDFGAHAKFIDMNHPDKKYGFKGPAVWEAIQSLPKGYVLWLDSGIWLRNNLEVIWDQIEFHGFYSPWSHHDVGRWTHPNMFRHTKMKPNKNLLSQRNLSSGIVGVDSRRKDIRKMLGQWSRLCQTEDCISPEGSSRKHFRKDQAILTLLFYKYGLRTAGDYLGLYPHREGRNFKVEKGLVSVIIPSFNRYGALMKTIKSVQNQSYKRWEIWIGNDGSTDERYTNTKWEALDPRIHIYHLATPTRKLFPPRSPGYVRNVCIEKAKGEWFAFLDDDDRWMSNKLSESLRGLQERSYLWTSNDATFGPKNTLWNGQKHIKFLRKKLGLGPTAALPSHVTPELLGKHSYLLTSGLIVHRSLISETSYFPLQPCAQDTALWKRLIQVSPALYLSTPLHWYDVSHAGLVTFDQIDRSIFRHKVNTSKFGAWSISYDCFKAIVTHMKGSNLLEFGSGHTTIELAKFFQVYSVEDKAEWLVTTNPKVHPIHCEICPLSETNPVIPSHTTWFDCNILNKALEGVEIDGILIDGPPKKVGRSGFVLWLKLYLSSHPSPKPLLIFDDTERPDEQKLVHFICENFDYKVLIDSHREKSFILLHPK